MKKYKLLKDMNLGEKIWDIFYTKNNYVIYWYTWEKISISFLIKEWYIELLWSLTSIDNIIIEIKKRNTWNELDLDIKKSDIEIIEKILLNNL